MTTHDWQTIIHLAPKDLLTWWLDHGSVSQIALDTMPFSVFTQLVKTMANVRSVNGSAPLSLQILRDASWQRLVAWKPMPKDLEARCLDVTLR